MATFGAEIPGNIIRDGRPRPPDNSVAPSSYTSYGSYSGVDIKVIVHYPVYEVSKALREAQKQKSQIERQLTILEADHTTGEAPDLFQELQEAVNAAVEDLDRLNNEIKALIKTPTSKVLAELQTISWSTHRDKAPVRTLGAVYPRSYVRSGRTVAGSMVFTTFYEHVLHELLDLNLGVTNTGTSDRDLFRYTTNLIDQVPPIDISIIGSNEYGAVSHMGLYGVEFVQDGGTFSIEDIFSESVVQYVARDIDPMRIAGLRKVDGQGVTEQWTDSAKGLAHKKALENAHLTRRSPFI